MARMFARDSRIGWNALYALDHHGLIEGRMYFDWVGTNLSLTNENVTKTKSWPVYLQENTDQKPIDPN